MGTSTPLANRVAVVTGGGRGIGRAIALRLAEDGAAMVVADINPDSARAVADEVAAAGGQSLAVTADVRDEIQVDNLVARAVERFGGLDIMVANAGIVQVKPIVEVSVEEWERIFAINARGVFLSYRAAARQLIQQGRGGRIIGAASAAGHKGSAWMGPYSATKFAVVGLTQAVAQELARHQITVNAYCPGIVATDMWGQIDAALASATGRAPGEPMKQALRQVALRRPQTPADVVGLVAFLASDDAAYLTGQSINVDGGLVYS